jgi:hypothetical protein
MAVYDAAPEEQEPWGEVRGVHMAVYDTRVLREWMCGCMTRACRDVWHARVCKGSAHESTYSFARKALFSFCHARSSSTR